MTKTTIFIPIYDGLFEREYGPHAYEGELTREQIEKIGGELGGVGGVWGGYARVAVACFGTDRTFVTYNADAETEPTKVEAKDGDGHWYNADEHEMTGNLVYEVVVVDLNHNQP